MLRYGSLVTSGTAGGRKAPALAPAGEESGDAARVISVIPARRMAVAISRGSFFIDFPLKEDSSKLPNGFVLIAVAAEFVPVENLRDIHLRRNLIA
jgi:hypothetical protein